MRTLITFFLLLLSYTSYCQLPNETWHVTARTLNLREKPNPHAQVLLKLKQYNNVTIHSEQTSGTWVHVSYNGSTGYVAKGYVKKGRAHVTQGSGIRVGAVCNDGTRSDATGRGACSHHGGVAHWVYSESQNVIISDQ